MIHRLPLVEMASLARSGAVSSLELVDAHLDRIERVNPHYNAFTMVLADQARASARRADQGLKMGPLHGVPVTVKERSFDPHRIADAALEVISRAERLQRPKIPRSSSACAAQEPSYSVRPTRRNFWPATKPTTMSPADRTIPGMSTARPEDRRAGKRQRSPAAVLREAWAAMEAARFEYPRISAASPD